MQGKSNTNGITSNNTRVCHAFGRLSHVPTRNHASLTTEIFHRQNTDHVALDLLIDVLGNFILIPDAKSNVNIHHLPGYGVSPEGVTILLVQLMGMCNRLGKLNTKLVSLLQIPSLALSDKRNDTVTLLQDLVNPLIERRFII